jgi:hypothetical protein
MYMHTYIQDEVFYASLQLYFHRKIRTYVWVQSLLRGCGIKKLSVNVLDNSAAMRT